MTPAFEHHDKIAAAKPKQWLRCVGPVNAIPMEGGKVILQPGTMLRVRRIVGGAACDYDAGGSIRTVTVPERWWHNLEIVETPA